ncbi:spike base protein, RCAP_Rcc01079 family [Paracoccus homiensis]|uniref:spike base protein, RCAP_Rcc01079 family n=1 Tax=Paracoccus homiensis TaxID=364199 RepID=UPI00398D4D13
MIDIFANHAASLESPATHLHAVAPSDDTDLVLVTRAIAVGAEGFVRVTTCSGSVGRVFVVPGAPFPIRATRIWATGTTATDIVALA